MGWGHRNVAFAGYILMLAAGGAALQCIHPDCAWYLPLGLFGIYGLLMLVLDFNWKKRRSQLDSVE
jgi:hypothetical protein